MRRDGELARAVQPGGDPGARRQRCPWATAALLLLFGLVGATVVAMCRMADTRRQALRALRVANRMLRDQAELYRSIVHLQTEWIARFDADLTVTFANAALARLEGRTPEELIGSHGHRQRRAGALSAVVAEGIETAEQLEHLQDLGCDRGQSYCLARPLTPEVLRRLLVEDARLALPRGGAEAVA